MSSAARGTAQNTFKAMGYMRQSTAERAFSAFVGGGGGGGRGGGRGARGGRPRRFSEPPLDEWSRFKKEAPDTLRYDEDRWMPTHKPPQSLLNKSIKSSGSQDNRCQSEMNRLMICTNRNNFQPGDCMREYSALHTCLKRKQADATSQVNLGSSAKYHLGRIYREMGGPSRSKKGKKQ